MCIGANIIMLLFVQAGGGRNEVDPRFVSLFSVYNITFPSSESLFHIYFSILQGHLQPFKKCMTMHMDYYMLNNDTHVHYYSITQCHTYFMCIHIIICTYMINTLVHKMFVLNMLCSMTKTRNFK